MPSPIRLASLCAIVLAAACGDNGGTPDAPVTTPDAPASADAAVCETAGYPETILPLSVDLVAPTALTLDGTGPLCDQLLRAITDPVGRPPELAQLDAAGATATCMHDDVLDREIVRVQLPDYAGLPLYAPVQDLLVHVDQAHVVQFLHGDFLPAGHAVAAACLDGAGAAAVLPGAAMTYGRFAACTPQGDGTYAIAADDELAPGDEGYFVDEDGGLRRVRAVELYLLADHVTTEIINSDAFCCDPGTLDHCVGFTMIVDALTGEILAEQPRCHIC